MFYFYAATSVAVLVAALASIVTAVMRRWELTRRLGRASFLGALGVFAASMLVGNWLLPLQGVDKVPAEAKAAHLAAAISEFMCATALAVPAFLIGAVTWLVAVAAQRRNAGKHA